MFLAPFIVSCGQYVVNFYFCTIEFFNGSKYGNYAFGLTDFSAYSQLKFWCLIHLMDAISTVRYFHFTFTTTINWLMCTFAGFLPEKWDKFFVKYLYPSFTPTVSLFVAGTVAYGVSKYLQNEKLKGDKS